MPTRVIRFLFLALLVAAGSGGVFWTWTLAQHVAQLEATGRQTAIRIDRLEALLDELSQQDLAYAAGQLDHSGLISASNQIQHMASESSGLLQQLLAKTASVGPAVGQAIASVAQNQKQVRESLDAGLDETAAGLMFAETRRTRHILREQLRQLRAAESVAVAEGRAADLRQAWLVLGGVALLFAGALVRSARVRGEQPHSQSSVIAGSPRIEQPPNPPAWTLDLSEVAALSSAIARMQSEAALPELLERMATLLGAPGIVIWMTAADDLFPVAGHGYNVKQWSQLGPVHRSSLNATAAAWRARRFQVVAGDPGSRAAIVAPMLAEDRCIGVLAVEIPSGRETDQSTQAVVTVVAAQLTGVLVAWPDTSGIQDADPLRFHPISASTG